MARARAPVSRLSDALIGPGIVARVDSPDSGPAARGMGPRPLRGDGICRARMPASASRYGTEAGGLEPPRVVNPPHFECGALPIRLRLQRLYRRSARESSSVDAARREEALCRIARGSPAGPIGPFPALLAIDLPASAGIRNRGARIRTGDLCDPNAALYRTEPRPEQAGRKPERTGEAARPSAGSGAHDPTM